MIEWLVKQFTEFNIPMFLFIVLFNSFMSQAQINKMLKKLHTELYQDFEEIKDEIWRANQ